MAKKYFGLICATMLLMTFFVANLVSADAPTIPAYEDGFETGTVGESFEQTYDTWDYSTGDDENSVVVSDDNPFGGSKHLQASLNELDGAGSNSVKMAYDYEPTMGDNNDIVSWGAMFNINDGDLRKDIDTNVSLRLGMSNNQWWFQISTDGEFVYDVYGDVILEFDPVWNYSNYGTDYIYIGMGVSYTGYYNVMIDYEDTSNHSRDFTLKTGWEEAVDYYIMEEGLWLQYSGLYQNSFTSDTISKMNIDNIALFDDDTAVDEDNIEDLKDRNFISVISTFPSEEDDRVDFWMFLFNISGMVMAGMWFITTQLEPHNRLMMFFSFENEYLIQYGGIVGIIFIAIGISQYVWGWLPS